jgi:1,4-dihydroxy-2-naphthoate octaprenyltransferase
MDNPSKLSIWLKQFRANFLFLAVVLVLLGLALAYRQLNATGGSFDIYKAILLLIGNVLAHSSVNLFNEYFDFKSKIDFHTFRNPFSGGSGMMVEGKTTPGSVLFASTTTLLISLAIGVYFVIVAHWFIVVLIAVGAFSVVFYNNILAKMLLGEFFAGLALGTFVVLGTYIGMTATPDMALCQILNLKVILISIPPGILTFLLLYLNEFPDAEADKQGGRFHLVIFLGKRIASYFYCVGLFLTYAVIIIIPILGLSSYFLYFGLLTLPLAIKAGAATLKDYDKVEKIIPAMGVNVIVVLITDLLLAIGVMLG